MCRAYQLAAEPESLARIASSGSRGESSAKTCSGLIWVGGGGGAALHDLPPARDLALQILLPGPVALALQQRDQPLQGGLGITHEVLLVGVALPDEGPVQIDLDRPGLPELGHELGVGKVRADGQQRVAVHHQLITGPGAQQPDRPGDVRQLVGQHVLAEQRLGHTGSKQVGHLLELGPRPARALPDQHRHLAARVEQVGGTPDRRPLGDHLRAGHTQAGRHHLEGVRRRGVLQLLHVGRNDDGGRRPAGLRGADRGVEHARQLLGNGHHVDVVGGDVLEQAQQVDLLLVITAHRAARGLPDDGHDRHVVELGVVQAVEQVDRTRPGGGQADSHLAGELGVADRLEGGHLLVPGLGEGRLVIGVPEGRDDAINAVARVAEHAFHPPLAQAGQQVVGDGLTHGALLGWQDGGALVARRCDGSQRGRVTTGDLPDTDACTRYDF